MPWLILILAGFFEVAWAIGMKYSEGLTKPWWTVFTVITLVISMALLNHSMKSLPVGSAYAVWTGIGAIGTAVLGILLFGESKELVRIFFILLIVIGIAGLRFYTPS